MQIVVDASALLAVLLNEPHRDEVVAVTAGATLCAPASLPWEMGNALSASLKRRRFSLDIAQAAAAAYEKIPIRLVPVDLATALELAHRHQASTRTMRISSPPVWRCVRPCSTLDQSLHKAAVASRISVLEV
ncbi:MAG: type II toxin-antitoxin system VapC family toxin [Gemmatimonadetes bacterium]|nr:type II toxin-antitoxin system VapC family toxin [Gemmatimonadota bacterium]